MVECVERVVRCPYREAWTSGRSGRTAREHAEWFVPTTKTWSNSTFKAALRSIMLTSTYPFNHNQIWGLRPSVKLINSYLVKFYG